MKLKSNDIKKFEKDIECYEKLKKDVEISNVQNLINEQLEDEKQKLNVELNKLSEENSEYKKSIDDNSKDMSGILNNINK